MSRPEKPLLSVRELSVHFPAAPGILKAVDGVSFDVRRGETLGLVGESGCGKSTLARAILQLIRPTSGHVFFGDTELTALWRRSRLSGRWVQGEELRSLRRRIQIVFQDPYASLDPRMNAASIISEPLCAFGLAKGAARRRKVAELMEAVGLDPKMMGRYPHEFSGGQRQRIGIARALAPGPDLLIADEPVSALDVSVQAQILNLLSDLKRKLRLTLVFIAHDLAAVRHLADRVAVMYLGRIVEAGDARAVYGAPAHPYTKALLAAVPTADPLVERHRKHVRLSGDVPSALSPPPGCAFHPRCVEMQDRCRREGPPLVVGISDGHEASCLLLRS